MKAKERTAIERVKMPELDPVYRATTRTEEVNIGLTKEMASTEAKRCLDCPKPTCMEGCPVSINIPSFIKNIERGQFLAAAKVLKNTSALPAVCGTSLSTGEAMREQVCTSQDERASRSYRIPGAFCCRLRAPEWKHLRTRSAMKPNGIKIAVVGSGPSGLSFAGDMAKKGFDVTVFEASARDWRCVEIWYS